MLHDAGWYYSTGHRHVWSNVTQHAASYLARVMMQWNREIFRMTKIYRSRSKIQIALEWWYKPAFCSVRKPAIQQEQLKMTSMFCLFRLPHLAVTTLAMTLLWSVRCACHGCSSHKQWLSSGKCHWPNQTTGPSTQHWGQILRLRTATNCIDDCMMELN